MSARPLPQLPLFAAGERAGEIAVRASPRARRLTVRVYPGGRVEVTVPRGTRPVEVQGFVGRHRDWIDARVRELSTHPLPAHEPLPARVALQAVGREVAVRYVERRRPGRRRLAPDLVEIYGSAGDAAGARRWLRAWLADEAEAELGPWLGRLAAERGFRYERLQVRRQRTRWGSCSRAGTISLNVSLLFQPPAVVRYLMLHELGHTRHMNHSARYWRLVASHEPDFRALDRELTGGWRHVPGWVYG
ncbi:MAG: M48 family metallopeptidase [Proteobacteria bacterium]|nr:M48 family metallopeptidase [Pseudomonadota bacterium]